MFDWSLRFRPAYRQLLRLITHSRTPVYVMSGTLTPVMAEQLQRILRTNRAVNSIIIRNNVATRSKVSLRWRRRTQNNTNDYREILEHARAASSHNSRALVIVLFSTFAEMQTFIDHMAGSTNEIDVALIEQFRRAPQAAVPAAGAARRQMLAYHSLLSEQQRVLTRRALALGDVALLVASTGLAHGVTIENDGNADNRVYAIGGIGEKTTLIQIANRIGRREGTGLAVCTIIAHRNDFRNALAANTVTKNMLNADKLCKAEKPARRELLNELTRETRLLALFARAVDDAARGRYGDHNQGITDVCLHNLLCCQCDALSADGKTLSLRGVAKCTCADASTGRLQCRVDVLPVTNARISSNSQRVRRQHRPSAASSRSVQVLMERMQRQRAAYAASTDTTSMILMYGEETLLPDVVIEEIARDTCVNGGDSSSLVIKEHWLSAFPLLAAIVRVILDDDVVEEDEALDDEQDDEESEHDASDDDDDQIADEDDDLDDDDDNDDDE